MVGFQLMTNVDRILAEAMKLSDEEKQQVADRILELVPRGNRAGLEASLARGIADIRAGRVSDFGEFLSELEAEDHAEASAQ